jgi:hypothetical protein
MIQLYNYFMGKTWENSANEPKFQLPVPEGLEIVGNFESAASTSVWAFSPKKGTIVVKKFGVFYVSEI